jgi:hypothetical protein
MRTLLLALTVSLALAVGAGSSPAEAHVIRVERADRHKPATVQYVEKVVTYHGTKVKRRYVYIELFNGATFRVNHCKRPVRMDMHIKTVRRLCGHHH